MDKVTYCKQCNTCGYQSERCLQGWSWQQDAEICTTYDPDLRATLDYILGVEKKTK